MTTVTKQTRNSLPTRTARAFKPLREVLQELENGNPLIKERETAVIDAINALTTYATYQSEKEKAGEDMTLERLKDSRDQMQELTDRIAKLSKTLKPIEPVVKSAQSIADLLSDTCKRLEKHSPVHKPQETAHTPQQSKTVEVKPVTGGWQIGNLVVHDQALALELMQAWVQ